MDSGDKALKRDLSKDANIKFTTPEVINESLFEMSNDDLEEDCEKFLNKVYKGCGDQLKAQNDYNKAMKGELKREYVPRKFKQLDFDLIIPDRPESATKEYQLPKEGADRKLKDDILESDCNDVLESVFDSYRKDKIRDDKEYKEAYMKEQLEKENEWISTNLDSILKIQSNWKRHYDVERFKLLKSKVFIIQRAFRNYLVKKYNFPGNFFFNDKYLKLENELFEDNYKRNLKVLFPVLFMDKSDPVKFTNELLEHNLSSVLPRNPFEAPMMFLFEKMLDFDLMIETDECYDDLWATMYDKVIIKNIKKMTPIQLIAVGGQHTLLVNNKGKIYSFGWNNYGQCGVPISSSILPKSEIKEGNLITVTKHNELKAKVVNCIGGNVPEIDQVVNATSVACGEDHSLILDQQGKIWAFGLNLNGQLGLGHNNLVEKPTKIEALDKEKIISVKSEGNINFAVNSKGELFMWPWGDNEGIHYSPNKIQMPNLKEKFKSISCGKNFAIMLTENGLVFSMGNSNRYGQLGHGNYEKKLYPALIKFFANSGEKIVQVSCGFKHVVAKSSGGRAYTWGFGGKGQLGLGNFYNLSLPSQVNISESATIKVYQVAAGFRSTFFLCEGRKIYAAGTNGSFSMEKSPVLFDVIDKIPEISLEENLAVVRILTTWNKSFSILYATIADYTSLKMPKAKLNNTLNILASRWDFDGISPPYIEAFEKYFPVGVMKKKEKAKAEEVLRKVDLDWRDRRGNKITAEKNKIYQQTRKFE